MQVVVWSIEASSSSPSCPDEHGDGTVAAMVKPKALSLDCRAAIRLGWLALLQTPSEIFTESESDSPQACRYC